MRKKELLRRLFLVLGITILVFTLWRWQELNAFFVTLNMILSLWLIGKAFIQIRVIKHEAEQDGDPHKKEN